MSVKTKQIRSDIPPLRIHKATGQAYMNVRGTRVYLGKEGTPEARRRYAQLVAQLAANGGELPVPKEEITVAEVLLRFIKHAEAYYRRADGRPTPTVAHFSIAMKPVRTLFGDTPAVQFGPVSLRAVREQFIAADWNRTTINKAMVAVRHIFKWAASVELIPVDVHTRLATVEPLRRGRCGAREPQPVRPVPQEHIDAVRRFVPRQVNALIDLQLLTAARAGELVGLRAVDIDMSGPIWLAKPADHKTAIHGHDRTIYIGRRGQEIIKPFLAGRAIDKPLFSPKEAEAERRAEMTRNRKTPLTYGNSVGTNVKKDPKKVIGDAYTTISYRRSIHYACAKAGIHCWGVHRLRHNAATALRREFGIEAARLICGHKSPGITAIYAEQDQSKALDIIGKVG